MQGALPSPTSAKAYATYTQRAAVNLAWQPADGTADWSQARQELLRHLIHPLGGMQVNLKQGHKALHAGLHQGLGIL